MTEIHMPRLSDTMEEGVIASWRKQVGDRVERGDVVAEIETDKAIMEMEAYDEGVLEKILVEEGQTVPIGTPIGLVGDGSGAAAASVEAEPSQPATEASSEQTRSAAAAQPAEAPAATGRETGSAERPKASPLARAVARDRGVDLANVAGSGPNGRIIRVDIDTAAAEQPAASDAEAPAGQATSESPSAATAAPAPSAGADEDVEEIPLGNIRKVIARRMTESKQQAPHFYLTSAVDVTDLVAFRADLNERLQAAGGPKVSVNDLVVKACATALRANPSVNVSFAGDKLLQHKRIHLGVAVAIESGLVVPVITDADRKSVSEIAAEGREKAGRAREGKLKPDEMTGSTFSVSNLGMFGIEEFSAVINPPEAAILAVGETKDEVRVRDGEFVARTVMRMTLSADHRAVDGAVGAVFLQQLTALLEDPLRIIA
ncbi:pyruvate dehydrogenase E2 component (dihydrolipoamide acetyltransferase) [Halopolyspora algeriensis]|uniref:Dihydrolipoamide acetyltransferase component of pyruvate dehydrogenase complex n=1 Tax=Halopolyspora algeriensis TaxID=1500506 RepID=A0A368VNU6_9ACTN|nr:dihydrolipoamide acetyltransferase family protein [Halopolyspora algeriensis]RCW43164.1 pyruvate dehydrogenase E2 component (dihydrolipoamide acetyltransferase) [Halopolyspora algeriensis]TQM56222.1 pyruvate dehydrogenase E2 component (dihydrolipoamide acetyltransferase) [Halopolyspora algeriensis]